MDWIDVSKTISENLVVWPGDTEYAFAANSRVADGDSCNTSNFRLSTHAGTHCDAPWHFEEDGKRLDAVDPAIFFGPATLIDLPDVDRITAADLPPAPYPARILFRTRCSAQPEDAPFDEAYVGLEDDAAQALVAGGVRLVGIDAPSIAPFNNTGPTHHTLLRAEVFIVEGLRLAACTPGPCEFIVLPLPMAGVDGAPCRAFLR